MRNQCVSARHKACFTGLSYLQYVLQAKYVKGSIRATCPAISHFHALRSVQNQHAPAVPCSAALRYCAHRHSSHVALCVLGTCTRATCRVIECLGRRSSSSFVYSVNPCCLVVTVLPVKAACACSQFPRHMYVDAHS